jgi:sigma-E factor negative regulatory protein RseC
MDEINHNGIIARVENGKAEVHITDNITCEGCGSKDACISGGKKDNVFFVDTFGQIYNTGDKVKVVLSQNSALNAVIWAYVIPFFVLIFSLIIFSFFLEELPAGLFSFGLLAVYYFMIYVNKSYFDKRFKLNLKHNSDE